MDKEIEIKREIKLDANKITLTTDNPYWDKYANWLSPIIHFGYTGDNKLPKKYVINKKKKTTVLLWEDNTKTIVKVSKDDKYDKKLGFLTAYFQKHSGLSRNKANKYLDELEEEK